MNTARQTPEVTIGQGVLRGRRRYGVEAFLGVPYAAPPVGPARWRAPGPPPGWPGTRDAGQAGPAAPQPSSRLAHVTGDHPIGQSEDCLTLNVWAPAGGPAPAPVLVFLHGGGFSSGTGGLDWYHGDVLARGGLVVVTVNYRLGALGFLPVGEANFGLRDQLAALHWVRDNIAAFGGDPGSVTVAGQSAGAISILAMLSTPAARGLFHRAILQSTPGGMRPQTAAVARSRAAEFLAEQGLTAGDLPALRDLPVSDVLRLQQRLAARHAPALGPEPAWQLAADDALVAADPVHAAGTRAADGMPILIGTTRDEATVFPTDTTDTAATTEWMFRAPTLRLADLLARNGNPPWVYRFDWAPEPTAANHGRAFGACHCIELPFVFGNPAVWQDAPMLAGAGRDTLAALTGMVQPAWIAFAKHADPAHDGIPAWPTHRPAAPAELRFDLPATLHKG